MTQEAVDALAEGAGQVPAGAAMEGSQAVTPPPAPGEGGPQPAQGRQGNSAPTRGLEVLGDIELQVGVELGRANLTIAEVLGLGAGSVVTLDKLLGDPVDLVVNERVIARGEVVVVDDKFGLRVTEIVGDGRG